MNPTYSEMAEYYGAVVIPARPRKPRDKAKVEKGVQVVEGWILAAIRNITFSEQRMKKVTVELFGVDYPKPTTTTD